jgi:hypothetical protein
MQLANTARRLPHSHTRHLFRDGQLADGHLPHPPAFLSRLCVSENEKRRFGILLNRIGQFQQIGILPVSFQIKRTRIITTNLTLDKSDS